jgi:hypothetical protein
LHYRRTHNLATDIKILLYTARRIIQKSFYPSEIDAVVPRLTPVLEQQKKLGNAAVTMENASAPSQTL